MKPTENSLVSARGTSNKGTEFFVGKIPKEIGAVVFPGFPHKTIGMVAGHIHNSRCMWIKSGQIVLAARVLGHRLPLNVTTGR